VLAWVAQYFGALPRPRVLEATYTLDPPQQGERQINVRRAGGTPLIYMTYHVPARPTPTSPPSSCCRWCWATRPGGRLHKRVVEQRWRAGLQRRLRAGRARPADPGCRPGAGAGRGAARAAMAAVVDGLAKEPVTAEELERARTSWLNGWEQGFTDPEQVGVALSEAISHGDWRLYFLQRDRVRQLTLADINRVAGAWLRRDNRTVGIYQPTASPSAPRRASEWTWRPW
jgi:zinc protease